MRKYAVCTRCGHEGHFDRKKQGSLRVELLLWLGFLLPGMVYSVWRLGTSRLVCGKCGSTDTNRPFS